MPDLIERRRKNTHQRIEELRGQLKDAAARCEDKACVYVTGSFGRAEASQHSDLDLFIVGLLRDDTKKRALSRLEEILVKADLIEATRRLHIPEFSGDGEYLIHYTNKELVGTLGSREDDANNTFTARLLLLLESSPLLGEAVYETVIEETLAAYWRDYADHKNDFVPGFLANDILRLWRTFCVNYEARTKTEPAEEKAKRKLKNYKLKHSRLLTCYSALLYLLGIYSRRNTVSPTDAENMVRLTSTQRLEWILTVAEFEEAHGAIRDLLRRYENFLTITDAPEAQLITEFLNPERSRQLFSEAKQLGNSMFEAMSALGNGNQFHRVLVV